MTTESGDTGGLGAMPVEAPRRAASLTLRADDIRRSRAASLDAANRSLADALRITYRLIQGVMIALALLFAFSGFQRVEQAERGVKVSLGRLVDSDLPPGFQFSLPYPLGQIIKVSTSQVQVNLDESFFPYLSEDAKRSSLDKLGIGDLLRPGRDGSLITGDGNLAHARFGVTYHRESPADFVANLADGQETALVRAAVERAAVQTIAQVSLQNVLKRATAGASGGPSPGSGIGSEIEERVRRVAQSTLDSMQCGLKIDTVLMRDETPPLRTRDAFQTVQTAETDAATARERAEKTASERLIEAAGAAYPLTLALIDDYGRKLDDNDAAGAEQVLETIFSVFDNALKGGPVTAGGREFNPVECAGEARRLVEEAHQYRSSVVQRAASTAQTFRAKLAQYRANPRVFIAREWTDAMTEFLSKDQVEALVLPDNTRPLVLKISSDPDIVREIRARLQKKRVEENFDLKRAYQSGEAPAPK